MKIAIISDTHGNEATLKKALKIIEKEKIKDIIHCGDVGGVDFLRNFKGFNLFLSLGNMDDELESSKNIKVFSNFGEYKNVAFCHFPAKAKELAEKEKYEFVFYGHTHKPWQEKINNCIMANSGNLAGQIFKATFAILKDKELKLKIL